MSINNSQNYQYREGKRATYTSPQYEDVVQKYMNYDPTYHRTTLGVNQGISEQNNFSKSAAYQPNVQNNLSSSNDPFTYRSVLFNTTNDYGSNNYQDRFSKLENIQVKEVQSPEKQYYNSEYDENYDRVKKSKKHQDEVILETKTNQDIGINEYKPLLVGSQRPFSISNGHLVRSVMPSNIVIHENPDLYVSQRLSNTNPRLQYQNQTESKSIQDQNIALCNIF